MGLLRDFWSMIDGVAREAAPPLLTATTDAVAVNAVINHPEVRPSCGLPEMGDLDFSEIIARPENLFLLGEHGGFMLLWSAPHSREIHVFLLPEGRGKWGFDAQAEVIAQAASEGVSTLWARISPDMPHLAQFARRGGMKPTGETIETHGVPYDIYSMEIAPCRLH